MNSNEEEINLMKEELHFIQAAKLSWTIETDTKLEIFQNNLRLNKQRSVKMSDGKIA